MSDFNSGNKKVRSGYNPSEETSRDICVFLPSDSLVVTRASSSDGKYPVLHITHVKLTMCRTREKRANALHALVLMAASVY